VLLMLLISAMETTTIVIALKATSSVLLTMETMTTTATATLLAIFTDQYASAIELGVLELTNGTRCFMCLLVEDNAAALGASIFRFENVRLER